MDAGDAEHTFRMPGTDPLLFSQRDGRDRAQACATAQQNPGNLFELRATTAFAPPSAGSSQVQRSPAAFHEVIRIRAMIEQPRDSSFVERGGSRVKWRASFG